ncbi:putative leucine-rich repeat-containing, plant-type, leucine-rich repeat domain, L [Medicago truncatula]|uniref:Putative leucine-rich repeat-containing, plant-type, leucine-rich repeat domain, L n=1 Tax=Medicago truncatula TaxID=3880 RepID=G7KHD8_MEDTR|nr:receptor-like protein [Medicago truncatula]RHN57416.1 putative leucine-rich repeat-containing, plant-type, leucine-rich repeat domain, L [Medicago truncatula]
MGSFFIPLPYFTFHFFSLLLLTHFTSHTFSLCNKHDNSALLQFKNSFSVNTSSQPNPYFGCSSFSFKTESWQNSTDCCEWDGVTCDTMSDHVIGLDLSCNNLKGELHPNSTIFQLKHLQQLNLAFNHFSWSSMPIGVGDLVKLTHLNLSNCYLNGNIPSTISHLSKLVSLDLSSFGDVELKLNPLTWKKLIHNATNLRELYLDNVNMSSIRESSLSMLKNLSSSLVSLSLRDTVLQGNISSDILSLPNLQRLDLSFNQNLSGQLPKSNWSTPLRYLVLSSSAFSGEIPYSIGQLKSLTQLVLSHCNFDGMVPLSLWNLTQLTHLDLSLNKLNGEISPLLSNLKHLIHCYLAYNNFSGSIPNVYGNLIKLKYLALSSNNLTGQVPSSLFHLPHLSHLYLADNKLVGPIPIEITKRSKLSYVFLDDNMLNGTIPQWCYSLPSLLELGLSDNHLTGFIGEFSTYSLQSLDLSNNNLQGHFPNSIFQLQNLTYLYLSSTNLSGVVDFHQFSKLNKLWYLVLSHNTFLSINIDSSIDSIIPNLFSLDLSSANINSFPKFQARNLQTLDLSNNNIHGKIPKWFHTKLLNSWKDIRYIDLSFNMLQGDLPIPPSGIQYFSLSNNNFTGNISSTFRNASSLYTLNLAHNNFQGDLPIPPSGIQYFSLSNNNFTGYISSTFCNASSLYVLDLAHNNLKGMIPQCLGTFPNLYVLDMQMNNLYGSIPRTFTKGNAFETIKLNGNQLEGSLPQSLANCSYLEVLDLGDNNVEDTFPDWLETLPELQVISLRSNNLHGAITCSSTKHTFPKLRIFDVSNNNFSGPLPASCIKNFQGMMKVNDKKIDLQYMRNGYYNDSVVVTVKGFFIELTRILTAFTTIDLSNNMFEGEIPQVIGELNSLKGLNLSNNGITSSIPQSLSHLRNLEWLDLSCNQLKGEIPVALTNLNFLSVLNLSQNHLEGIIPKGQQFNTFGNDSFEGNTMLCGFPLSKSCKNEEDLPPHSTSEDEEESGFGWKAVAIGYACGAIFGLLFGYNVFFFTGKPEWLVRHVEHMFDIRLKRTNNRAIANRRRMN